MKGKPEATAYLQVMHFPVSPDQLARLTEGAVAATTRAAVFRIEGPGALDCLQGLLTNDVAAPGNDSIGYGALLTPRGMIVVDAWVLRRQDELLLVCDASGRERAAEIFRRSLPPRLARVTDVSGEWTSVWLLGKRTPAAVAAAGLGALRERGRVKALPGGALLASAPRVAPFEALLLGERSVVAAAHTALLAGGASEGGEPMIGAAMVLAGWPALGREIGERTLPQEVRFDELDGVSYSKGCYTGQETVARIHFRGHVNRLLRGTTFEGRDPLEDEQVMVGGKPVGTVHSTTSVDGRLLGLAVIRREVGEGEEVSAGGRTGQVVALPFSESPVSRP